MIETDAVVVGAGPVGLWQAFQLGLLEIATHVVDALPEAGGQCSQLYPDKPIHDIPALPGCHGRDLAARLLGQLAPLGVPLHLGRTVTTLESRPDGRFALGTGSGEHFIARAVFIAAGVGAFEPRRLKVAGIEPFVGRQVLHHPPERTTLAGQRVVVFGDDDAALAEAVELAEAVSQRPASVTLVHRRDVFGASDDTVARMRAACTQGRMQFIAAQPVGVETRLDRLSALLLACADGSERRVEVDTVLALLGLSPRLGPIADWGLAMSRRQLVVDTEQFATSVPGIHAVGDIVTYPGKRRLIVCGFHEATLAAYGAAARLRPDQPLLQQYTTTSPRLHRLLGVASHER